MNFNREEAIHSVHTQEVEKPLAISERINLYKSHGPQTKQTKGNNLKMCHDFILLFTEICKKRIPLTLIPGHSLGYHSFSKAKIPIYFSMSLEMDT